MFNVLLLIFNCIKFVFGEIVVLSFNFIYNYIAVINVDNTYKCCVSFSVCLYSSNYIYIAFKFSFYFFFKIIYVFSIVVVSLHSVNAKPITFNYNFYLELGNTPYENIDI